MDKIILLSLLLGAGLLIGLAYFGGLWLSVKQLSTTRHPALLLLGSWGGRLVLAMLSFHFLMGGQGERLVVCLIGFLGGRGLLIKLLGPGTRGNKDRKRGFYISGLRSSAPR
jgi:F1F0 ATPase subunit 2